VCILDTFKNWQSEESTVFLENKVIIVPESVDKKGYLAMKYVSYLCFFFLFLTLQFLIVVPS